MRGWGYVPYTDGEQSSLYLCPWHDDHHPSLSVRKVPLKDAENLSFKCFACGESGFGAVQLAARLMGFPAGEVAAEDLPQVLNELLTRCDVTLPPDDGEHVHYDTLRTELVGWDAFRAQERQYAWWTGDEPIFEPGEWTEEGLKALGLKVELATRKVKKSDVAAGLAPLEAGATDESGDGGVDGGSQQAAGGTDERGGGLSLPAHKAEIKVGDMRTQFDPDTGAPLYRCSLGKDFYRGPDKAEVRTIASWGEELKRVFGVEPVGRFLHRIEPQKGGAVVRVVRSTKNYPIFIFDYPWGVKKYEPRDTYGNNKWTWWRLSEDADLYHRYYADAQLRDALLIDSGKLKIEDSCLDELDDRHPFAFAKDKNGNDTKKVLFERVVLCSGPRDAIAVWSHSSAHVVWLHSEQAGFDGKKGSTRPNRWLRSLIKKLLSVTMEGGLYVCYDEDETGLASSQAIALNNPQVRWLRLPKELTEITLGGKTAEHGMTLGGKTAEHDGNLGGKTAERDGKTAERGKRLKDVTDFVTRFSDVERLLPSEVQHDDPAEWFDNAMYDTPSCKFWQWESGRKDQDGTERARYKFDLRNTPVFLRARGMVRHFVQQGKESFSRYFLLQKDNTYTELFGGDKGSSKLVAQARDLMAEWLCAHKEFNDSKGALSRSIYSAKLEQSVMETIEEMKPDDKSFGEDFDYFFFHNAAVMVTSKEIKKVPYTQMKWWTNSEAILDGDFSPMPQSWHVEVTPFFEQKLTEHDDILRSAHTFEEREQENMRWDQWQSLWHYRLVLDRPICEMPVHFRFLWNVSRIFWDKEAAGQALSKTEQQMQDVYLIAILHALGSALVRHRSANRQQFIHITDNGTRREDLASGGTGKTAILELLSLMRRVLKIDGKALSDGNIKLTQETEKVVPGLHNIVAIDELPPGFSPQTLYNCTLSLTSRGLYRGSVKLEGDDLPKFVVASNEQLDLSSDSTNRRIYQLLVGDWYHPKPMDGSRQAHTPSDDFRNEGLKEVARNLSPSLLNEARNLLLGCVQLFFQFPDETIRPPKDSRALLRQALAASKDEQFTFWISHYLSDSRHIGIPIAQRELAISLLDYCGIAIGEKTVKGAFKRIRDNLDDYLRTSVFVCNPPVVLLTPTDRENKFRRCAAWMHELNPDGTIKTGSDGRRQPRVLEKAKQPRTYYFYRKGRVPRHFYEPGHDGDPDYVQAAPDSDPEANVNED